MVDTCLQIRMIEKFILMMRQITGPIHSDSSVSKAIFDIRSKQKCTTTSKRDHLAGELLVRLAIYINFQFVSMVLEESRKIIVGTFRSM